MAKADTSGSLISLKAYQEYPYASYMSSRLPYEAFKRHLTLGHARNSIRETAWEGPDVEKRLYKFNYGTGEWEELQLP